MYRFIEAFLAGMLRQQQGQRPAFAPTDDDLLDPQIQRRIEEEITYCTILNDCYENQKNHSLVFIAPILAEWKMFVIIWNTLMNMHRSFSAML